MVSFADIGSRLSREAYKIRAVVRVSGYATIARPYDGWGVRRTAVTESGVLLRTKLIPKTVIFVNF